MALTLRLSHRFVNVAQLEKSRKGLRNQRQLKHYSRFSGTHEKLICVLSMPLKMTKRAALEEQSGQTKNTCANDRGSRPDGEAG